LKKKRLNHDYSCLIMIHDIRTWWIDLKFTLYFALYRTVKIDNDCVKYRLFLGNC